ncbi:MAG TPA: hypothetical protein VMS17_09545 [Gemmataceae bacterium]|nr:hypothetical protein [Gemmataceae bacterium]
MPAAQQGRPCQSKFGRVIYLLLLAAAIWTCSCGPQGGKSGQTKAFVELSRDEATFRWDGDAIVQDAALTRDEWGDELADVRVTVGISYYEDPRASETKKEWSKTFSFAAWAAKEQKIITIPAAPLLLDYTIDGTANNNGAYVRLYNDTFREPDGPVEPSGVPYFEIESISNISAAEIQVKLRQPDTVLQQDWGRCDFLVMCHREGEAALEKHRFEWPSWKKDGTVTLVLPLASYERIEFKGIVEIPDTGGRKRVVSQDFTWDKK